jgi:hypothetical protein
MRREDCWAFVFERASVFTTLRTMIARNPHLGFNEHHQMRASLSRISRHGSISEKGLTPTAVALLVKERATAAGLDPGLYAGYSLRAGFATSAAIGGAPEWAIMKQTGHSRAMLDRYVRPARRFRNNPVSLTGL